MFAGVLVGSSGVREASGWAITSLPSDVDDGCLIISLPTLRTRGGVGLMVAPITE